MKIFTAILLILFFVFRNSFTLFLGKRDKKRTTFFIFLMRKVIEIIILFFIPILIIFGFIKSSTNVYIFLIGTIISIIGLSLMAWTRFGRKSDWGFMGDDSGELLFINGPYKVSRHPYYIGAILFAIGLYAQLNYFLIILTIPAIFFISHVIKKEESFLANRFGHTWEEYKTRVGIFPWFY
ncbi:MAG: isoprenylcysteine carboxylmethyltransferase family protein [Candidatus Paceibacterota bacterium]